MASLYGMSPATTTTPTTMSRQHNQKGRSGRQSKTLPYVERIQGGRELTIDEMLRHFKGRVLRSGIRERVEEKRHFRSPSEIKNERNREKRYENKRNAARRSQNRRDRGDSR